MQEEERRKEWAEEKEVNGSTAENTLFVKDAYSALKVKTKCEFYITGNAVSSDQHMEFYVSQIPLRIDFLYLHHFL